MAQRHVHACSACPHLPSQIHNMDYIHDWAAHPTKVPIEYRKTVEWLWSTCECLCERAVKSLRPPNWRRNFSGNFWRPSLCICFSMHSTATMFRAIIQRSCRLGTVASLGFAFQSMCVCDTVCVRCCPTKIRGELNFRLFSTHFPKRVTLVGCVCDRVLIHEKSRDNKQSSHHTSYANDRKKIKLVIGFHLFCSRWIEAAGHTHSNKIANET